MSHFDINSLVETNLNRAHKHQLVYKTILKKIYHKIKLRNKRREYQLRYEVPNYQFGYALYNTRTCIVYVIKSLRDDGLTVTFSYPNKLFISWEEAMRSTYKKKVQPYQRPQQVKIAQKPKKPNYSKINSDLIKNLESSKDGMSQHLSALDDLAEFTKYY